MKSDPELSSSTITRSPRAFFGRWLVRKVALLIVVGTLLTFGIRWALRRMFPLPAASGLTVNSAPRPLAEIVRRVRAAQFVTVELHTAITVTIDSPSWRGDARAEVTAPVRYLYAVDLSNVNVEVQVDEGSSVYIVRIDRPKCIAVEVDTLNTIDEDVEVSGTRTRGRAGETALSLARKQLSEQARRQQLRPADREWVEQETLDRVRTLVERIVSPAALRVEY
jgi:hypothetical protein